MIKKEYITPEIEEVNFEFVESLLDGSSTQNKGEGEAGDDDDLGAKGWSGDFFNSDGYEE